MKKNFKNALFFCALVTIAFVSNCGFDDPSSKGLSFEEQLAIDVDLIDSYLLENEIDADVLESGVRYIHDFIGEGESPEYGDLVVIKYKGTLLDGTFFGEDSIGLTLKVGSPTIAALQIIIPLMNVGGRTILYSPSGYCFGNNTVNGAPANSNLIFEIELLAIIRSADDQLTADENIIDEFLLESHLEAETHTSGIRFITLEEGIGDSPTIADRIFVKYKGTFLTGQTFDQNTTGVQFTLSGLIEAWKIMIPTMKEGGKIKIYAPSKYCYGTNGSGSIPANVILVFEIELVEIR